MIDQPEEIDQDFEKILTKTDQSTIEIIRLSERTKIFNKLRNLIYEKQQAGDSVAENVLGWAYEKLAD